MNNTKEVLLKRFHAVIKRTSTHARFAQAAKTQRETVSKAIQQILRVFGSLREPKHLPSFQCFVSLVLFVVSNSRAVASVLLFRVFRAFGLLWSCHLRLGSGSNSRALALKDNFQIV